MLRMRKDQAWSQEELAIAAGLNLRTIQRIEREATASLQSMKALAVAFAVNIRDLQHEESAMLSSRPSIDSLQRMTQILRTAGSFGTAWAIDHS